MKLQHYTNNSYDTIVLRDEDGQIIDVWRWPDAVDDYHKAIANREDLAGWAVNANHNPDDWQPKTGINTLVSEYVTGGSIPEDSMTQYVIADAISQAGGSAPGDADWNDAYRDDIEYYARDDATALAIAEAAQSIHDRRMLELHPGIDRHDGWYNAPCYANHVYKYVDGCEIKVS